MKLTIEINMDNAAFDVPDRVAAVRDVLTALCDGFERCSILETGGQTVRLLDNNGNTCGTAVVSES